MTRSAARTLTRLAVVTALGACAVVSLTGSVSAKPDARLVHTTPRVPVVIDGVRYAPADIHKFDGRALYLMVDLKRPNELIGYTQERDFKAAADAKKAAYKEDVAPASAGQYAIYYSDDEWRGDSLHINSGWGVNNLVAVARGCGIFGCAGNWNDVISSVWINGHQYLYRDANFGGGYFWAIGYGGFNLSTYGFDNVGSSLNVWY